MINLNNMKRLADLHHTMLYFYMSQVKDVDGVDKKLSKTIDHYETVIRHHIENDRFLLASKLCDYKRDMVRIQSVLREADTDRQINREYYNQHKELYSFLNR